MAGTRADNLKQFTVTSVEELDEAKEMGRGCYGAVFRVRLHGLPCIAKRLHDILVGRGREERVSREQRRAVIDRFREECVLLSSLRHPNVVQFMGVHYGRDEANISLIMEYMHMDLDQCMKTYPDIPLPYKTSILRDVAYGLAYLHSIPIIHRDLNAGNVLLTESLRAKIADLGVAKLFDRERAMIHTRTLCPGAQDFMPPECLDESPKYNTQLDIFSFGHLAVYLTNQKAPVVVDRMTPADVLNKQIQIGKRRRSLTKMGGPDHPLYSIAVQCLSDTPDQRPTSRDLVRRMEELCKKQPLPYSNTLQTLTELTAKDHEIKANMNAVELKSQLDDQKQMVEELGNELAVFQTEAVTYRDDFLQERKDREAKHAELVALKDQSAAHINRLEIRIRELERDKGGNMQYQQLQEDYQISQSQILAYKKQMNIGREKLEEERKKVEEERKEVERRQSRIDGLNIQLRLLSTENVQLKRAASNSQMESTRADRLQNELEHMTAQNRELERIIIQLRSSNQVLSARLQHKSQSHHSPPLDHTPPSDQHHIPPGAVNVRPQSERGRWQQPNARQVYQDQQEQLYRQQELQHREQEQLYRQQQQEQQRQEQEQLYRQQEQQRQEQEQLYRQQQRQPIPYSYEESAGRVGPPQQQQQQQPPTALPHRFNQHGGRSSYSDDMLLNTNAAPASHSTDSPPSVMGQQYPSYHRTSGHTWRPDQQPTPAQLGAMAGRGRGGGLGRDPLSHQSQLGQAQRQQQPSASSSQLAAYSSATAESSSKHNVSDSSDVAEDPLIEGIDKDMLEAQREIEKMYVDPPDSIEGTGHDDSFQIPYDPNLICPKCGKQFRRGEIQKLRKHHDGCQQ